MSTTVRLSKIGRKEAGGGGDKEEEEEEEGREGKDRQTSKERKLMIMKM